jgi:hypothetical protein
MKVPFCDICGAKIVGGYPGPGNRFGEHHGRKFGANDGNAGVVKISLGFESALQYPDVCIPCGLKVILELAADLSNESRPKA